MDTVTLPREEYDSLVQAREMLDDVIAFDRAVAAEEEGLPHAFMKRLIAGEPSVRVFREWRGLSMADLATKAAVDPSEVAALENGGEPSSVGSLARIASALGVSIDELV